MKTKATIALLTLALMIIGCGKDKEKTPENNPNVLLSEQHLASIPFQATAVPTDKTVTTKKALFAADIDVNKGKTDLKYTVQVNLLPNRKFEIHYREYDAKGRFEEKNDVLVSGSYLIDKDGVVRFGDVAIASRPTDLKSKTLNVKFSKDLRTAGVAGQQIIVKYEEAKSPVATTKALKLGVTAPVAPVVPAPAPVEPPKTVLKATPADIDALDKILESKDPKAKLNVVKDLQDILKIMGDVTVGSLQTAIHGKSADLAKVLTKGHVSALEKLAQAAPAKPVVVVEDAAKAARKALNKLVHTKDDTAKLKIDEKVATLLKLKAETTIHELHDALESVNETELAKLTVDQLKALTAVVEKAPALPKK